MNTNAELEITENTVTGENIGDEVEQRLAEIAAAMQAKMAGGAAKRELPNGMACPIDPAERALCEGCQ